MTTLPNLNDDDHKRVACWLNCREIPGNPFARIDALGNIIHWTEYGNRNSPYGWELDHYPVPRALGGSDNLGNLRALCWIANASHGNFLSRLLNSGSPADTLGLTSRDK